MNHLKILLIGGPGTGKSSLIQFLEEQGHACLHEISRELTMKAQKEGIDQLFLSNPLLFSELLLKGRIKQFREADENPSEILFFDRGIPDVSAYLDYNNDICPSFFREANVQYRYDLVFMLPIWKEIYSSDNERYESYDQALEIQKHLRRTYTDLGYHLIPVPKTSIENRAQFIMQQLCLK